MYLVFRGGDEEIGVFGGGEGMIVMEKPAKRVNRGYVAYSFSSWIFLACWAMVTDVSQLCFE